MLGGLRKTVVSSSLASFACGLVVILPPLSLLYYIHAFGVNVIAWDELTMVPLVERIMSNTLSFSDLVAQHNEHRLPFARIAMLALGRVTQYNTVYEMYLSWGLLCLSAIILFYLCRKSFETRGPQLLLIFLPVSIVVFSFRQYHPILFGFACHIYFMVLGVVAAVSFLDFSRKLDPWFALSLLSGIVASFSFVVGLMVWPAGLVQIIISERKRKLPGVLSWCFVGTLAWIFYFYDYVKPSWHPALEYFAVDPWGTIAYFLTLIGSPFSFIGIHYAMAAAMGVVVLLIGAAVFVHACRGRILRRNGVWLSFIAFAVLSSVANTIGRAGFGVELALGSRYTPITVLGIVGLYFLAMSVSRHLTSKRSSFGVSALLTMILIGMILSSGAGWHLGPALKDSAGIGAYVLQTYSIQSDENIRRYLYPDPASLREFARFLEMNGLNVFSGTQTNLSKLNRLDSDTFFQIETVDGKKVSEDRHPLVINSAGKETLNITGWAVDKQAEDAAFAVFITIDGHIDVPTYYGLDRPDISLRFNNLNFRFSGYMATFSSAILERGQHTLSIKIVARDGVSYYWPGQVVNFVIV